MLDPATRKATGYYCVLGVTLWDVHVNGFTQYNLIAGLLLAGVAGITGIAELIHGKGRPGTGPGPAEEG